MFLCFEKQQSQKCSSEEVSEVVYSPLVALEATARKQLRAIQTMVLQMFSKHSFSKGGWKCFDQWQPLVFVIIKVIIFDYQFIISLLIFWSNMHPI